ncbi:MAG TPA: hypothetical protein VM238_07110 [Phycisphaerae bacterium]|nr:hypothetical protein [Phycisphaerae bacterium]
MGRKKKDAKPGHAKILDAWSPPPGAGDPVGCVATSFTFSPVFFEEECLSRFLCLQTDPTDDGALYLVEREEKLAQVTCAAALVDQYHARGPRSLRWDLLAARVPGAILHAKVAVLVWQDLVRLIVASANLTEDGYRRNLEVFGVLDYREGGDAPRLCLTAITAFLREAASYAGASPGAGGPALDRWNGLLDTAERKTAAWGEGKRPWGRDAVHIAPVLVGPGKPSAFETIGEAWAGYAVPARADVVSPFFDPPDVPSRPAEALWGLLRQRGEAEVWFHVTAEEVPGEAALLLHAPSSLKEAEPTGRAQAMAVFSRIDLEASRPLHMKGLWLESDHRATYLIGSSNFTAAGMGLANRPNLEANLLYAMRNDGKAYKAMVPVFPDSEEIPEDTEIRWQPSVSAEDEATEETVLLPAAFDQAVYCAEGGHDGRIELHFAGTPPAGWVVLTEDNTPLYDEAAWESGGSPLTASLAWAEPRPPSGVVVRWQGAAGCAWWPVNVAGPSALPPPDELRDLPLEVLIDILTSARPLHEALRKWVRRWREQGRTDESIDPDPHKRVDTSAFLLQRTRRVSWALEGLRERLERPVATREGLQWRLRGPVGVMALKRALFREGQPKGEKAFLLAELALELARVKPRPARGCLSPKQVKAEIAAIIRELEAETQAAAETVLPDLRKYVRSALARAREEVPA